jgi:hypothetical protein
MSTTDLDSKLSLASQLWHVLPLQAYRGCHGAYFKDVGPCYRDDNRALTDSAFNLISRASPRAA